MASEAQVEANRANAQKSTGPRTPEGKAVVAQNAVRHGLRAETALLLGEDQGEYGGFRTALLEELAPEGVRELELAGRIADLSWRLRRAGRYQDAVLDALCDRYVGEHQETEGGAEGQGPVPGDRVLGRMLLADFAGARILERTLSYERRIENSLDRVMAQFEQLRGRLRLGALRGLAAGGDFPRETAPPGLSAVGPVGQTKPTEGVSSVKCQVSSKDRQRAASAGLHTSHFTLPTAAQSRQTNPIYGPIPSLGQPGFGADGPGRAWDLLDQACERQPLLTGIRHPFAAAGAGERKKARKR